MTAPRQYDFGVTDETATRFRQVMGVSGHMVSHPGLVAALVSARPSQDQLASIGGFVDGLELAKQARLVREAGAKMDLTSSDRTLLGAVNEPFSDIDASQARQQQTEAMRQAVTAASTDTGSHGVMGWMSKALRTSTSFVFNLPVVKQATNALNRGVDIAMTPYRTASMSGPGTFVNPFTGQVHASDWTIANMSQVNADAQRGGYDPTSAASTLAFVSRGAQVYRSMNDVRDKYGSANVDAAQAYIDDPSKFLDPNADADTLSAQVTASSDPRFKELVALVDSKHISPGRDFANGLGARPGTKAYTLLSGATDGLVTWYIDPFLIAGKVAKAQKIGARGIESMTDDKGIARVMIENAAVKRGWTGLLEDAKAIRSGDDAKAAAGLARIRARTPDLLPLVDEINGTRVVPKVGQRMSTEVAKAGGEGVVDLPDAVKVVQAKPIETYDELVAHVTGTAALTRLSNGLAASQAVLMPGAVSRYGYRAGKALLAGKLTERGIATSTLDFSKAPWRFIPTPGNAVNAAGDAVGDDSKALAVIDNGPMPAAVDEAAATTGDTARSGAAARGIADRDKNKIQTLLGVMRPGLSFEQVSRRLTSMLPTATKVDYNAPEAVDQFRRFGLTYMPKAQANLYAAMYSNADVAGRRAIYKGAVEQIIHSSGMESTASGKKLAEAMRSDLDVVDKQKYSTVGLDEVHDDSGLRRVGLWPGQMSTEMWLPSFSLMQRSAAKVGIWDHTIGAVLTSRAADVMLSAIRTGWLVTGSNAIRNAMDQVAAATARGVGFGNIARARSSLSADVGRRMLEREIPNATDNLLDAKATQIQTPLSGAKDAAEVVRDQSRALGRLKVMSWFHRASGVGANAVAKAFPLKGLSRAEIEQAATELGEGTGRTHLEALRGIGKNSPQSTVTADGLDQATSIAAAGLAPKRVGYKLDGWDSVSADGESGARAWMHNIDQRFTEDGLGWAVLHMLNHDTPEIRRTIAETLKRHAALDDFRHQNEMLSFLHDTGLSEAEVAARMDAHIDRLGHDMASQVMGRSTTVTDKAGKVTVTPGEVAQPLVDHLLEHGKAPSLDWIERNIPNSMRPEHAIGREWVAVPNAANRVAGLARGYTNFLTRAYDHVVNKPISYMSSEPIYAVNYALARKNLAGYEALLTKGGMSAERAKEATMDLAHAHAWDKTVTMIDNPEVQSHFSVLGRNFLNFERAQEQFIRRWRDVIKEDPSRIRKAQLLYQGGTHSGIIDHDESGNPIFVYPGSGAIINTMLKAAAILPGVDTIKIPTVPNLHSQVIFLNPSLDNPIQLSFSPVVGMPTRILSNFFPDHSLGFSQLDQIMNGTQGAGRNWWEQFMPSPVGRFMKVLNADDRQSQVASAMRNSIVNLDAAGLMPGQGLGPDGKPKPPPSPDEVATFLHRLQVQTRNQLFLRSIFSFFLPAAPGLPDETAGADNNAADAVYQAQGIQTLKAEYRKMVNDFGYDKAVQVWAKTHPDDMAYTVGTTTSKGGAFVPPTDSAMRFIQSHRDLFQNYPSVAAYFLPQAPEGFSPAAWNAELSLGLRQYKNIDTFYNDVVTVAAERNFYAMQDAGDKALADAMASGNTQLATKIRADRAQWNLEFNSLNPLFAAKRAGYDDSTPRKQQAIAELQKLITDGKLPGMAGGSASAVGELINAYQSHTKFTDEMRSRRDALGTAQKQAEQTAYQQYMERIAGSRKKGITGTNPELTDLYNGLFRGLN